MTCLRARLAAKTGALRLLLIVDQFEELFTLCKERTEQQAYVDNLLAAAVPEGVTTVILTLRADFYARCAEFANLRLALSQHQNYIGPMSREELRAAIEKPAAQNGWDFEPGLVDAILDDVEGEAGSLPLLSHALLETWKRRSGRTLTFAGYHAAGGVHGAIAKTADARLRRTAARPAGHRPQHLPAPDHIGRRHAGHTAARASAGITGQWRSRRHRCRQCSSGWKMIAW